MTETSLRGAVEGLPHVLGGKVVPLSHSPTYHHHLHLPEAAGAHTWDPVQRSWQEWGRRQGRQAALVGWGAGSVASIRP